MTIDHADYDEQKVGNEGGFLYDRCLAGKCGPHDVAHSGPAHMELERLRGMQNASPPWTLGDEPLPKPELGTAKTDEPNPKDLIGVKKVPTLSVIPTAALVHMGRAMENGAAKYGPFNWRQHAVQSSIYIDAALRHIMAWVDGEEDAADSGVHHLGHAMAGLAIVLDAMEADKLIDQRVPGPAPEMLERYKR